MEYLIGVDLGTTSTRAIVFDLDAAPVAAYQQDYRQILPQPGWLEHDPAELVQTVLVCLNGVSKELDSKGIDHSRVKAIGITNQRETTILWDKSTGKAVHNAIVWSDCRTEDIIQQVKDTKSKEEIERLESLTGLRLSAYFAAPKIRWILDNCDEARAVYERGNLCFSTIDSWLLYNLTSERRHVTDVTNASRSLLCNIRTLEWDKELIKFWGFENLVLPEIVSCAEVYGHLITTGLSDNHCFTGVPISGCLGDQSAALVGHGGFERGDAKNTYGTGCFLLYNTGNNPVFSENGLLTTVGFAFNDGSDDGQKFKANYALEGSIAAAGSVTKWMINNLEIMETSEHMNELAGQVEDAGGVIFVTAFSGLFAPYWDPTARASILGMTQFTTKKHLARAALEATSYQTKAIIDAMTQDDKGYQLRKLLVDGGMTNSDVAMQIQADILGMPVMRPHMREPTALGAAVAAGLGVKAWGSLAEVKEKLENQERTTKFLPKIDEQQRKKIYSHWKRAVDRARGWIQLDEEDSDEE